MKIQILPSDGYLFNIVGGIFVLNDLKLGEIYHNVFFIESTCTIIQAVDISNIFGSSLFNAFDSHLDLSSFILTHCSMDLLLTCLHCNGSVDNLVIENSSFTSLFYIDDVSMRFNATSLTKVNAFSVFEIFNSNFTVSHLNDDTLRIDKLYMYSELSTVRLSSIIITNVRVASDHLFVFNHSELSAVDLYLSAIECSSFSLTDSSAVVSEFSLSNANVSFNISNSNLLILDSSFHSIDAQILVSADILSNVTIERSVFSLISANSLFVINNPSFIISHSLFSNVNLQHFIISIASSFSLQNSSFDRVDSSQSLFKADSSEITVKTIEVADVLFETVCYLNDSKFTLIDLSFASNITLFNSFLIGYVSEVVFRDVKFLHLLTPNEFPLITLSNSKLEGDLLVFEFLNCTLFEFIYTEVYLSNTSFDSINSPSIGFIFDSSLFLRSSIFSSFTVDLDMILFVNSSASFDDVEFDTIKAVSLIDAKTTEVTFNSCSFTNIYSFAILNLSDSSSCSIDFSLVFNVITDGTIYSNNSTLNLINTKISDIFTQSFLMTAMSDIDIGTMDVHNSTISNILVKSVETVIQVDNLNVTDSQIFEFFQIIGSRFDLFSVELGSSNCLTNSLFNMSYSTVSVHGIDISGPFDTNNSLIKVLGSTLKATQFNVDQLTSPFLISCESSINFNVLSILNFNAGCLISINSTNSTFSNLIISNFHSQSDTSTVSVTSSTLTVHLLLLDRIRSTNFMFFNNSNGSISDSVIQFVNSSDTFISLASSVFRFENVTTINANVTSVITLDLSELYCYEFIISRATTNSVLVSKDSIIALSMFAVETTIINTEFAAIANSSMNSTSLSFTNCNLSVLFQASYSSIELNYVEILNNSFSQPIIYYVFNIYGSQFLLTNFYADVINLPIITARDSEISF
ncbi:hypothetical protein GEMRC1_005933 [Eukaryota sp. GEM-RC1]